MDRRHFLSFSLASASLVLSSCGGNGGDTPDPVTDGPVTDAQWQILANALTGTLVRPDNTEYASIRLPYNSRYDAIMPAAIVRCSTAADVSAALLFALQYKLSFTARSGGHSYVGYSTTTGIIIDLSRLNKITIGNGTATIGAGAKLIDVYDKLTAQGVAIPTGSCPTVGIGGLTLGGGIGIVDRAYGLTCDNLVSAEVVTANGKTLICDATNNSDLFWALRGGGGGNFGIVTSFTFKTHATRDILTFEAYFNFADFEKVMAAWQAWPKTLPDSIWAQVILSWFSTMGSPTLYLRVFALMSEAEFMPYWTQFLVAAQSTPISTKPTTASYRRTMLNCDDLKLVECGTAQRNAFAASSDFFDQIVPTAGILALKQFILDSQVQGGLGMAIMNLMGGEIDKFAPDETAFIHRKAIFGVEYYTWMPVGTPNMMVDGAQAWLNSFRAVTKPWSTGRAYVNYLDPLITDWKAAYYGTNYTRLAQVKAKYDPNWVFRIPQGVELS